MICLDSAAAAAASIVANIDNIAAIKRHTVSRERRLKKCVVKADAQAVHLHSSSMPTLLRRYAALVRPY